MSHQASRKHYCTNKYVRDKENIDEEWCGVFFFFSKHINKILLSFSHDNYFFSSKLLLGDRNLGCPQFK